MFAPRTADAQQPALESSSSLLAPPSRRQLRKSDNELHRQRSRSRSPSATTSSSSSASSWRTAGKRRTFSMRDLLHKGPSEHSSASALLAASLFASTPSASSGSGSSGDDDTPPASGADLGWSSASDSPNPSPPQRRRRDKLKSFLRASGDGHHHRNVRADEEVEEKKHRHRHRHRRSDEEQVDTGDDDRPRRHHLKPHRYHTEANLCQARAPLITIDDASPLSSPDAARNYRPQPPLGIDDDGDHQGGPTPHLAFAEPPLLAAAQGAAGALVSQASAATTRPHATSGPYDNPQHQQHYARAQEQYRQYQRQYQHEHPLEELRQQQQEPHQRSQRPHPVLTRAESAPALPPMTPPARSSLAAIERAFPSSSPSAAQPDRPPRLPPLCEAADEGLEACAGEKRRNRMARVRERRAADKEASQAVLYFPDRTEESVIGEFDRSRHLHRHHDYQHDQEQHHHHQFHHRHHRHSKEAKANPFEVAHFPPPRLYGSSRLSLALPPGSPCPAAAADVDVGHQRETRAEGNTKTDEEEQLPDFPFPVSPHDTWALMRSLEQLYRDGRTAINRDTIVGRKLYNFRDLSEATQSAKHGVKVASQRIFRSACLSRGDVDHVDVAKSLIYLREFVQVKTMIDFRNKDERMSDPLDPVVDAVYPRIKKGTFVDPYNIPLMNKSFKIMGLFLPSKWGTKMNMVKAVVYGSEKTPTEIFAEEAMNPMGLLGLNKLMLVYGKEEIAQVLRICANSSNYPIMYHCSSGKDRTGLITALILLCCGVDAQDIITNYHQSEIFLSPVMDRITAENQAKGLNAGFDGTPPEVMEQTIGYIFEKWGSITGYFSYIGFGSRDQMKLVQHLAHNSRK